MSRNASAISRIALVIVIVIIIILAAGIGSLTLFKSPTSNTTPLTTTTSSVPGQTTTTSSTPLTTSTGPSTSSTNSTSSSTGTGATPNSVTMDISVTPNSLDPASIKTGSSEVVDTQIYETLLYYNGTTGKIMPWLASNYTVAASGLQYNFSLRQGIKFDDGTPFNATAVKFSIDRQIIQSSGIIGYYEGALAGAAQYTASNKTQADVTAYQNANGVVVLSPYEVQFNLVAPDPSFPLILSMVFLSAIVSPAYVNAHGGVTPGQPNTYMDTHMGGGTGPYTGSYNPSTGSIILSANQNYWGSPYNMGPPKIKNLVFNIVTDDLKESLDLKSGAAQIIQLDSANLNDFVNKSAFTNTGRIISDYPGVKVWGPYGTFSFFAITFNLDIKNPDGTTATVQPFQNKNIRLAMEYAFNQSAYLSLLNGIGIPMVGAIPKGMIGYNSSFTNPYPFNLTEAQQLLVAASSQLGYSPSHPLTVTAQYPTGETGSQDMLTLLASAVNSLNTGFTISVVPLSNPEYLSGYFAGTWQMGRILWGGDFPDPDSNLQSFGNGISGTIASRMGQNNTMLNSLLAQEKSETNATLRAQLVQQCNQIITQEAWYVWGAQLSNIFATTTSFQSIPLSGETTSPLFYFVSMG